MSGKGSAPRPYSVDQKTFEDNFNRIFGKKHENSKDDQRENQSDQNGCNGRAEVTGKLRDKAQ